MRCAGTAAASRRWCATCATRRRSRSRSRAPLSELGRVDACFANAGVPPRFVPSGDLDLEEWRRMTSIHLEGSFFTLRAAFRHMIERGGGGSLVGTSSTSAVMGTANAAHYAAAKAGVIAVLKSLAVEGARHRIRANAIIPGWIDTAFAGGMYQTEAFEKRVLPRIPLRRVGRSDDFRAIAVYLASERASTTPETSSRSTAGTNVSDARRHTHSRRERSWQGSFVTEATSPTSASTARRSAAPASARPRATTRTRCRWRRKRRARCSTPRRPAVTTIR